MESSQLGEDANGNKIVTLMPFVVWKVAIDNQSEKDKRTKSSKKAIQEDLVLAGALDALGMKLAKGTDNNMQT